MICPFMKMCCLLKQIWSYQVPTLGFEEILSKPCTHYWAPKLRCEIECSTHNVVYPKFRAVEAHLWACIYSFFHTFVTPWGQGHGFQNDAIKVKLLAILCFGPTLTILCSKNAPFCT
jgi:hypothetical protein